MSSNKHRPHLVVLPEDEADRRLVSGFQLVFPTRQIYAERAAVGWAEVLDKFSTDHVAPMEQYPERLMVLLIDFDAKAGRLDQAKASIPPHLVDRVFVLGSWTDPEALTRPNLGSLENIGSKIAKDCHEGTDRTLGHELLRHNAPELDRLRERIRPILFPAAQ